MALDILELLRTPTDDPIGKLCRCHIAVERHLHEYLTARIDSNHQKVARSLVGNGFKKLADLCLILGLDKDAHRAALKLNGVRNKCAHNADFELQNHHVDELFDALSDDTKWSLEELYPSLNLLTKVEVVSTCIGMAIRMNTSDIYTQQTKWYNDRIREMKTLLESLRRQ